VDLWDDAMPMEKSGRWMQVAFEANSKIKKVK
jgi:hypothetical protein